MNPSMDIKFLYYVVNSTEININKISLVCVYYAFFLLQYIYRVSGTN